MPDTVSTGIKTCLGLLLFCVLLSFPFLSQSALSGFPRELLQEVSKRFGKTAPQRLEAMRVLSLKIRPTIPAGLFSQNSKAAETLPEMAALKQVNDFFNQIPYFTDIEHWGVDDYWATPVEFVASGGGDCEDYAIAKYMVLKELGFPIERLRITYVRALSAGETHMVLAYYPSPEADPWILDNLLPDIRTGSQRTDLKPVYSFNDDDLWFPNGSTRKGGATVVRQWRAVIDKMALESSGKLAPPPQQTSNRTSVSAHL